MIWKGETPKEQNQNEGPDQNADSKFLGRRRPGQRLQPAAHMRAYKEKQILL